jgi:hypothetical protein
MSDDDTLAGVTQELETASAETVYAWQHEPPEDEPETDDPPPGVSYRPMIAVAALAAVALAIAGVAAVVSLASPARQPDHYSMRPPVVEQAPAPRAALAPPKATPAPVVVQPPVAVQPPPVAVQPNANQRFGASLAQGKMWQQPDANDDQQARSMCADLAAGGSVNDYVTGTERKSPQLLPQEAAQAVHDAIESYCPQYG